MSSTASIAIMTIARRRLRSRRREGVGSAKIIRDFPLASPKNGCNRWCAHIRFRVDGWTSGLAPPRWKFAAFLVEVRVFSKQSRGASYYLHDRRVSGERQRVCHILRLDLALVSELHLDELARSQRIIERADQGRGKTVLANVHRRIQVMRFRTQLRALATLQFLILPGFVMKGRTSIGVPFQKLASLRMT